MSKYSYVVPDEKRVIQASWLDFGSDYRRIARSVLRCEKNTHKVVASAPDPPAADTGPTPGAFAARSFSASQQLALPLSDRASDGRLPEDMRALWCSLSKSPSLRVPPPWKRIPGYLTLIFSNKLLHFEGEVPRVLDCRSSFP